MKTLVIIDLKYKIKSLDLSALDILSKADSILALTPFSTYLLDNLDKEYITFHDLISIKDFKQNNLNIYNILLEKLKDYKHYFYLLRKIMIVVTYQSYIKTLNKYIKMKQLDEYNIVYISDKKNKFILNDSSILIDNRDQFFYKKNKYRSTLHLFRFKKKRFQTFINKFFKHDTIAYDAIHYTHLFHQCHIKKIFDDDVEIFIDLLNHVLVSQEIDTEFFHNLYSELLEEYSYESIRSRYTVIENKPFTYLSQHLNNIKTRLLKLNNCQVVFFQHGSYMYAGEHSQWCEVLPATINFVCNDYTKELFLSRGANKVYSVGSENFNFPVRNRGYKYDFLYITHCTHYAVEGVYTNIQENMSIDAQEIYKRHKKVIELFATRYKNKKICIKIQAGIFMGSMMYVPFLELSKNYPNITVEFSLPIQHLIQKSKYIISDYFSSEFLNRELHYKRDIILFQGSPLPLPQETLDDMKKMFILINSLEELEAKIDNIEEIVTNRKRDDKIIEYYSSKKCDTNKRVTQILEKELYERA